jgi:hypothetical protein
MKQLRFAEEVEQRLILEPGDGDGDGEEGIGEEVRPVGDGSEDDEDEGLTLRKKIGTTKGEAKEKKGRLSSTSSSGSDSDDGLVIRHKSSVGSTSTLPLPPTTLKPEASVSEDYYSYNVSSSSGSYGKSSYSSEDYESTAKHAVSTSMKRTSFSTSDAYMDECLMTSSSPPKFSAANPAKFKQKEHVEIDEDLKYDRLNTLDIYSSLSSPISSGYPSATANSDPSSPTKLSPSKLSSIAGYEEYTGEVEYGIVDRVSDLVSNAVDILRWAKGQWAMRSR